MGKEDSTKTAGPLGARAAEWMLANPEASDKQVAAKFGDVQVPTVRKWRKKYDVPPESSTHKPVKVTGKLNTDTVARPAWELIRQAVVLRVVFLADPNNVGTMAAKSAAIELGILTDKAPGILKAERDGGPGMDSTSDFAGPDAVARLRESLRKRGAEDSA